MMTNKLHCCRSELAAAAAAAAGGEVSSMLNLKLTVFKKYPSHHACDTM